MAAVSGLALTVLVLSILVAALVLDRAQRLLDEDLLRQQNHIAAELARLPAKTTPAAQTDVVTSEPASSRFATVLLSSAGTVEATSQGPSTLFDVLREAPTTVASWPATTTPTTGNVGDTPIRYLATDLGDGQRILVVGDLEDARDQALLIAFLIAAAGLVCLITGALVTSWAVNRAMRPLADLTASATAIARESTTRLPIIAEPAEIAALSTSINDLIDQLDAEHRRRTRFLATVSHEVRTPLAIARGHLDALAQYGARDDADVHDTAHLAASEIRRAGTMVESLLTLARADEPGFIHPHPLLLADFANDIAIRFAGLSANITLTSPPPLEVDIDSERVAQALLNVVANSIRHNSDEVNVRVDWLVDGQLLAIQADDDGRGFPDRPDGDLLAPFVSGEAGGSGLGLSVAQTIAAAHGGRVILGSSPAGGARVVIEIPVVRQ